MPDMNPNDSIRLNKLVRASRERVFEALTVAEQAKQWWGPYPACSYSDVQLDARVGGELRVTMHLNGGDHDGEEWVGVGRFTHVEPPRKLSYTWTWENDPGFGGDSLVTFELFDADNPYDPDQPATEVVLTHERIGSAHVRSEFGGGWQQTLRGLGYFVRGIDPREALVPSGSGAA